MRYYVNQNAQPNGDHEVHTYNCTHGPEDWNRTYLGDFTSCTEAVRQAKTIYRQSNGCYYCSNACHTS